MSRRGILSALLLSAVIFFGGNALLGKLFEVAAVKASAQLAQGAAGSFGSGLDKALSEAANNTANKQCPKPVNDSFVYRSDKPKNQQYTEGGKRFTNLYGKPCQGPLVAAFCSKAEYCDAKMPGSKCSIDGEWGECKQADVVQVKTTVERGSTGTYSDIGKGSGADTAKTGPTSPASTQPNLSEGNTAPPTTGFTKQAAETGSGKVSTAAQRIQTFAQQGAQIGSGQSSGPSSLLQPTAQTGSSQATGPAFTSGGAQLALGTPPAGSGGGPLPLALQQRPGIPLTPSIPSPTLPRPQNTFGNVITGLPVNPPTYETRYARSSGSLFSFIPSIPSFSPVVYLNQATQFVQTIITPPTTRVVVVAPPALRAPTSSRQPTNIVSVVSLSPTTVDLVGRPQARPERAQDPIAVGIELEETSAPSAVPSSHAFSEFLDLQAQRAQTGGEAPLPQDVFTAPAEDTPLRALPQQPVLFPQASFAARGNVPVNSFSTGEDAHAVSIVDLISAVMTGSFAEVKRAIGLGEESRRIAEFAQNDAALSFEMEAETADGFAPEPTVETQEISPFRAPQIRVPELPKPAWNPAQGISEVIAPSTVYIPPPRTFAPLLPVPELQPEALPEKARTQNPVDRVLAKVEGFFRSAFGWLSRGKKEPTGSMSASREGDASVRLLADPPRAQAGTHTTLYWTSSGVNDCSIVTADGAQIGNGPEGTTLTPKIVADATFSATCTGDGQTVRAAVRVRVE